jgi:hypothetical protein
MRRQPLLLLFFFPATLLLPAMLQAQQLWSGILSPSRAINWTNAGIPGGVPDGRWTQCGATIAPYGSSGSPASTSTINSQIAQCSAQTYVQLGAGTFYLTGSITLKNQVVIRGQGANSTFLEFYGMGSCNGLYSQFCAAGSNSSPEDEQNYATWTAGFAQGSTSITLSNSLNMTAGSTLIILDQQDNTADTGNVFNCIKSPCAPGLGGNSGSARTDHTCSSSVSPGVGYCSQQQEVLVTACSPSCNSSGPTTLTISPGLYMPNWNSAQSTGAFWASKTAYQEGIENLSADLTSTTGGTSTAILMNCYQCWVSGIRSIDSARNHVWLYECAHCQVQNSYFYQSTSHNTQSYGIEEFVGSSDNLMINNICQQVTDSCPNSNGSGAGNVAAYNFAVYDIFLSNGWFQQSDYDHASGNNFTLREGNDGLGFNADQVHGTHNFTTLFRNRYPGWQVLGCGSGNPACSGNTSAIILHAASRYFNVVGNVAGQSGYHTNYLAGATANNQNASVFYIGAQQGGAGGTFCANAGCTSTSTSVGDPLTSSSVMLWGNYDTVNGAAQWNSANLASSFGDTTGTPSAYVGLSSPSETLPASLFMAGTKATTPASPCGSGVFFNYNPTLGTCEPYPFAGPDVTSGNLGICSGGTYAHSYAFSSSQCTGGSLVAAFGGHANANPAMTCFLSVMGGPPDGSGNALPFNASSCYGADASTTAQPGTPTNVNGTVTPQ